MVWFFGACTGSIRLVSAGLFALYFLYFAAVSAQDESLQLCLSFAGF
jgi:hypothetical protein